MAIPSGLIVRVKPTGCSLGLMNLMSEKATSKNCLALLNATATYYTNGWMNFARGKLKAKALKTNVMVKQNLNGSKMLATALANKIPY